MGAACWFPAYESENTFLRRILHHTYGYRKILVPKKKKRKKRKIEKGNKVRSSEIEYCSNFIRAYVYAYVSVRVTTSITDRITG